MKKLSFGKYLNLSRCASDQGGLSILALDHRNNLRKSFNPASPELVSDNELIDFKYSVTKSLSPIASAILLDPEVGVFQAISKRALSPKTGLIISLESTGYQGNSTARVSGILPGWSVEKSKRAGANAVKLLVYYHPKSSTASNIENLVEQIEKECINFDIPFILEILTYSLDANGKKLTGDERKTVIIESAKRLSAIGGDLLKVEFPLDISSAPDEKSWGNACGELSLLSHLPWVLLSASVSYETFIKQVEIACKNGACGIAAGRSVWNEAIPLEGSQRENFLLGESSNRLMNLSRLVDQFGNRFSSVYECQDAPAGIHLHY